MEERDLKMMHIVGGLKSVKILEAPMSEGYVLQFEKKEEGKIVLITMTRRARNLAEKGENIRIFKTIDYAVQMAKEIGFYRMDIEFKGLKR